MPSPASAAITDGSSKPSSDPVDPVTERLAQLEQQARQLELTTEDLSSALADVDQASAPFLEKNQSGRAIQSTRSQFDWSLSACDSLKESIQRLFSDLPKSGLGTTSGRFFGYIPGGGLEVAAIADFIGALTNRYSGVYGASPEAAAIENAVIQWLCQKMDYPKESWGTTTSGGSLANLQALYLACESKQNHAREQLVFYYSDQTHHSVQKSLRLLGIRHGKSIQSDPEGRLILGHLQTAINQDLKDGKTPCAVIGQAGTTNTGAIDDLDKLADVCHQHQLWLHVDGAYGALFYMIDSMKKIFAGLPRADSLTLDPHKGMFMPYGCGALLVRDGARLKQALADSADYLVDVNQTDAPSPTDYSIELTRPFRALRIWLGLKTFGEQSFVACLEEKVLLARYLSRRLRQECPLVELYAEPSLSLVVFRAKDDDDHGTRSRRWLEQLHQRGRVCLSSSVVHGRYVLRSCILSFRSHQADVDTLVDELGRLDLNS